MLYRFASGWVLHWIQRARSGFTKREVLKPLYNLIHLWVDFNIIRRAHTSLIRVFFRTFFFANCRGEILGVLGIHEYHQPFFVHMQLWVVREIVDCFGLTDNAAENLNYGELFFERQIYRHHLKVLERFFGAFQDLAEESACAETFWGQPRLH